jgi:hypothetical protein
MQKIAILVSILVLFGCASDGNAQNWICEGDTKNISGGDTWNTKFTSSVQVKNGVLSLDGTTSTHGPAIPLVQPCASTLEEKFLNAACISEGRLVYHFRSVSEGVEDFYMNLTTGVYSHYRIYRIPAIGATPSFGVMASSSGICRLLDR